MARWVVPFWLFACAATPVAAQSTSNPVDAAVRARLGREWGVDSSRVVVTYTTLPDSTPGVAVTDVRYARRGGRLTVTYRRESGQPRTISARAGVLVSVPVATRLLLPGDTIDPSALRWENQSVWGPPSGKTDVVQSGYLVRGRIVAGQRINATVAIPRPAIRAGSTVALRWSDASISVEMSGLALGTGYLGDIIPVRLRGDGDRVMATIIGPGRAQLHER